MGQAFKAWIKYNSFLKLLEIVTLIPTKDAMWRFFNINTDMQKLALTDPNGLIPTRAELAQGLSRIGYQNKDFNLPVTGAAKDIYLTPLKERGQVFQTLAMYSAINRRVFSTDTGYLVHGPKSAIVGDGVWIVMGCPTPLVLRRTAASGTSFQLVAEAYVHGAMGGEAVSAQSAWQQICLVLDWPSHFFTLRLLFALWC